MSRKNEVVETGIRINSSATTAQGVFAALWESMQKFPELADMLRAVTTAAILPNATMLKKILSVEPSTCDELFECNNKLFPRTEFIQVSDRKYFPYGAVGFPIRFTEKKLLSVLKTMHPKTERIVDTVNRLGSVLVSWKADNGTGKYGAWLFNGISTLRGYNRKRHSKVENATFDRQVKIAKEKDKQLYTEQAANQGMTIKEFDKWEKDNLGAAYYLFRGEGPCLSELIENYPNIEIKYELNVGGLAAAFLGHLVRRQFHIVKEENENANSVETLPQAQS